MWEDEEEENSPKKFRTVICHWAPYWQYWTSVFFIESLYQYTFVNVVPLIRK